MQQICLFEVQDCYGVTVLQFSKESFLYKINVYIYIYYNIYKYSSIIWLNLNRFWNCNTVSHFEIYMITVSCYYKI